MTHGPLRFKLIDKIFSVLYFNKADRGSCLRGYRIIYQSWCTAPSRQWREHWSQTKCCRSRPNLRFPPSSPRMDQPSLNLPEFARHQTLRRLAWAQPLPSLCLAGCPRFSLQVVELRSIRMVKWELSTKSSLASFLAKKSPEMLCLM